MMPREESCPGAMNQARSMPRPMLSVTRRPTSIPEPKESSETSVPRFISLEASEA